MPRFAFRVFALLLLGALPIAALSFTLSTKAPPPAELLLGYDAPVYVGDELCTHGSGATVDLGQTFRLAADSVLDKVTFKVRPDSDVALEFVTVLVGTFTDPEDDAMNEILAAEINPLPRGLEVGETRYLTLDLDDLVLEGGRQYGVLVGFTGGGHVSDARLSFWHTGGDPYAGGQAVASSGGSTWALAHDLAFFVHGRSSTDPAAPLLLRDGRFRVEATWTAFHRDEGAGVAVPMTDASGCFWFFEESNLELFVKVLDGCALTDAYWVFVSGLTNVEVDLTVTDRLTGAVWRHHNPLGTRFPPVFDVGAFETCTPTP